LQGSDSEQGLGDPLHRAAAARDEKRFLGASWRARAIASRCCCVERLHGARSEVRAASRERLRREGRIAEIRIFEHDQYALDAYLEG
jgi:hypothetical protein